MKSNNAISISVGELAEFVWRAGDLKPGKNGPSAQEGARAHRRIQKTRVGYRSEVTLSQQVVHPEVTLTISGRADLISDRDSVHIVEEIKTTLQSPLLIDGKNPVHWAQVRLYGYMYAVKNQRESLELQVTYFNPETDTLRTFSEKTTVKTLAAFFDTTTQTYLDWMARVIAWRKIRSTSLASLRFPFATPRPGQQTLADSVAALPNENKKLFVEAPTGSGKTMAVLWGATAALAQGTVSQILFLTTRSMGRGAAQDAGQLLQSKGAALKMLTLYARDVLCMMPTGTSCSGDHCPLAKGHFDRLRDAMNALFAESDTSRETVQRVADAQRICAYWLSRAVLPYVDLAIGDYNYFFDPGATLLTLTAPVSPPRMLLVDEAHNLPDRARHMFSATLSTDRLIQGTRDSKRSQQKEFAFVRRCLDALIHAIETTAVDAGLRTRPRDTVHQTLLVNGVPEAVTTSLDAFIDAVNADLASSRDAAQGQLPGELLNAYFDCLTFSRAIAGKDDGDRLIGAYRRDRTSLIHFCVDPAPKLRRIFEKSRARAVFFSATLSPMDYYRRILGGDMSDQCDHYPSNFPPERRRVVRCVNISTRYRDRSETREKVATMIRTTVLSRPGNYLVFFPSFAYLTAVAEVLDFNSDKVDVTTQKPGMNDSERQAFLKKFRTKRRSRHLVGLAMLGGLFSEAVDLPGHQLIGAIVVSPGLPMVSLEQSLIQDHFEQTDGRGFEYAYIYPGMNKAIQAAGRVHRSGEDEGVIVFIGQRFAERSYAPLLQKRWPDVVTVFSDDAFRAVLNQFWRR